MAAGVADQRHHRDLRVEAGQQAHAVESEPLVAVDVVLDPLGSVAPLRRDVAGAVAKRRIQSRCELWGKDVHLGGREVAEAAGVVDVEVGRDDMAHVAGVEPEPLDLPDRGLGGVGHRAHEGAERLAEAFGVGAVGRA